MGLGVCELCGRIDDNLVDAVVEGAMLSVCRRCIRFGHVLPIQKPDIQQIHKREILLEQIKEPEIIEILVPDYPQKVQQARENLNLKQEELALKIAEKLSVIHQIESGHLKPSFFLAKKLENFLKIKLIQKYKEEEQPKKINLSDSNLTIGDILKLKK